MKNNILASIEMHGKCDISGLLSLYPHIVPRHLLRLLVELRNDGWIKIAKYQTIDGYNIYRPWVNRTKKQLFYQPELFN